MNYYFFTPLFLITLLGTSMNYSMYRSSLGSTENFSEAPVQNIDKKRSLRVALFKTNIQHRNNLTLRVYPNKKSSVGYSQENTSPRSSDIKSTTRQ